MPKSKSIDAMADEWGRIAERKLEDARRPNLRIEPDVVAGLRKRLEHEPMRELIVSLEKAVETLRLSPTYTDPKRAFLLASSLNRRPAFKGIFVGSRKGGQFLRFALK